MHVVLSEFIIYYNAASASLERAVVPRRKFSLVWIYLQFLPSQQSSRRCLGKWQQQR